MQACVKLTCAALFVLAFLPLAASAQGTSPPAYDLTALYPEVRAAVLRAREAETRAQEAAVRAREAAASGEDAAQRARNGEPGYREHDYENDPESRRYEGGWSDAGKQEGFGVLTFGVGPFYGDRFAGQWRNGRKILGVYVYAPQRGDRGQSRYEGEYQGALSGFGVYYTRRAERYAGSHDRRGYAGHGVYHYANGNRYEGEVAANRPHGHGVLWTSRGRVRRSGIWANGILTTRLSANGR